MSAVRIRPMPAAELIGITDPCGGCGYPRLPAPSDQRLADRSRVVHQDRFSRMRPRSGGSRRDPRRPRGRPPVADLDGTRPATPGWAVEIADLWGMCGVSAHTGGETPAYLTVTAAELLPTMRLPGFAGSTTAQLSADAAVILDVGVCARYRRQHIGRNLVRATAAQLVKRQVGMIEVIATPTAPVRLRRDRREVRDTRAPDITLLPLDFWLSAGFRIVRPHPVAPTLRLDLAGTERWLPDFAGAWQRFADLLSQPAPPRPASFGDHQRIRQRRESVRR